MARTQYTLYNPLLYTSRKGGLLKSFWFKTHLEVLDALRKAIQEGRISDERVNKSLERIFELKQRYCMNELEDIDTALWNRENIETLESLCENSVTLLKNEEGLLPLKLNHDKKVLLIMPDTLENASLDGIPGDRSGNLIRGFLSDKYTYFIDKIDEVDFRINPYSEEVDSVVGKASQYDLLILGTHRSNIRLAQGEMVKKIFQLEKDIIWIALNTPYDLLNYPQAKTYLCTYGDRLPQLKALCRLIAGEIVPKGRLPVTIPGLFEFGEGITAWDKI